MHSCFSLRTRERKFLGILVVALLAMIPGTLKGQQNKTLDDIQLGSTNRPASSNTMAGYHRHGSFPNDENGASNPAPMTGADFISAVMPDTDGESQILLSNPCLAQRNSSISGRRHLNRTREALRVVFRAVTTGKGIILY